jgi:prepilin-type N-terminal cleavage/methylation domain-containing protein
MRRVNGERALLGFTLLEIMTVVVIIAIIAVLLMPLVGSMRDRAQRTACASNLRSLHQAASGYIRDNGNWPQISPVLIMRDHPSYAQQWQDALNRYGGDVKIWICPAIQGKLGNPDYVNIPQNRRVDYIACPFDDKPGTPFLWPKQPWFLEKADIHGSGNLIVFPDGSVKDMEQVLK